MSKKYTLRQARILSNMTQIQVATILGIRAETLGTYERGQSYPDVKIIKEMLNLYHVDFDDLIFLGLDTYLIGEKSTDKQI